MYESIILVFGMNILGVLSQAGDPSETDFSSFIAPPAANCTCIPFYECYDEESSSVLQNVVNDRTVITVGEDDEPGECPDILDMCCYDLGSTSTKIESANPPLQLDSSSLLEVSTQDFTTSPPVQLQLPSTTKLSSQSTTTNSPHQSQSSVPTVMTVLLPHPLTQNISEIVIKFPVTDTPVSPQSTSPSALPQSSNSSEILPTQASPTTASVTSLTTVSQGDVDELSIGSIGSCGIRNSDGVNFTIDGFKEGQAQYGEFPWMVAVLTSGIGTGVPNKFVGGGSLIDPSVVLTAAHKAFDNNATLKVRIGEWNFAGISEPIPHQDIPVSEIIYHPRFNRELMAYNYALLILDRPAVIGDTVSPICLSKLGQTFDGQKCIFSGWGKDDFGKKGRYQRILKSVSVNMVEFNQCQSALRTTDKLGSNFKLHKTFVCAGDQGQDACTGDGGSPLVCLDPESPGRYVQVGIAAWGIECGLKGIPGVYSAVGMVPWIQRQLDTIRAQPVEINDKKVFGYASHCSTNAVYAEKHEMCISCPKCHTYNPKTSQCNRKFRCG